MDTADSVEQAIRMIDAGCEIVRFTAPSIKEAENLHVIRRILNDLGYNTPLVADIHFTPNAAEVAAEYVEKVRINPGNYADKKRFQKLEYTEAEYKEILDGIRESSCRLLINARLTKGQFALELIMGRFQIVS
jgi:(E)-4-hydroxy-3-methylbut-2-enyl-diphosphate synthase